MGLFGSSKAPPPPLPNLSIYLSTPLEKVFQPDETVSGTITLTPAIPITPQALEVTLFGQSLIWYRTTQPGTSRPGTIQRNQYIHFRDNAPLFNVTTNILPPQTGTLQPGQPLTLPFNIRFPLGTGNKRLGQYRRDSDERWTVGPHNLPPSFIFSSSSPSSSVCDSPDFAKIDYGISARLLTPEYIGFDLDASALEVFAPVLFSPQNAGLDTTHATLTFVDSHSLQSSILAGVQKENLGFRQSLRDRLSSSTPKICFDTSVHVPDCLISGQEFAIRAGVHVTHKSDSVSAMPSVKLRVGKIELVEYTAVRAPRDFESWGREGGWEGDMPGPDKMYSGRENQDLSRGKVGLNCVPGEVVVEMGWSSNSVRGDDGKGFGLGEKEKGNKTEMQTGVEGGSEHFVTFTARVPSTTTASFRSFAISRAYGVKLRLNVEIGGKTFEQVVESGIREMGGAIS